MERNGRIVTFYSYKGGTGRSMALANVAWTLASTGRRVLAIDWDLEAPGLQRYFAPFLSDPALEQSTGVIDFILEFATAAVSQPDPRPEDWYMPYANLLAHAQPVNWNFERGGLLDFVPAGRQDAAYATRVNGFNWGAFYSALGGGVLLEVAKQLLREQYDYVLIDSRTGVSDTSGVCTIQMPDHLVVCFTYNEQSVAGAAAVAASALQQRLGPDGKPTLTVWPVPMRVEYSETERLERVRALARARFSSVMHHMPPLFEDQYWGEIEIPYFPLFGYEEVLAAFADRPRQTNSMLASVQTLTRYLLDRGSESMSFTALKESDRLGGLARFRSRPAAAMVGELELLGREYESIRARMEPGPERTELLDALVARARLLCGSDGAAQVAEQLFRTGRDGARVVGLGVAQLQPQRNHAEMALSAIREPRSNFEQFYALVLAEAIVDQLDSSGRELFRDAVAQQRERLGEGDANRFELATRLLSSLALGGGPWNADLPGVHGARIGRGLVDLVEIRPVAPTVHYDDPAENHGPWLASRQRHTIRLPQVFRIGRDLVTNELFAEFVRASGYQVVDWWPQRRFEAERFRTSDGTSFGPPSWSEGGVWRSGEDQHPVSGVSFVEALAFVNWCNATAPVPGWKWILPSDDMWEYCARTEAGLIYPWGDTFDSSRCNSRETGSKWTSPVDRYEAGASRFGCRDMAGNLWEHVDAEDGQGSTGVLRGGSFDNDRFQLRSYLRLFGVSRFLRAPDFGMRLAQRRVDLDPA